MALQTELLAKEIRALRRGRGVQADDLERRLGPSLRMLPAGDDDPAVRRRALISVLDVCASRLQADMRMAVVASLGLNGAPARMSQMKTHVEWLAFQLSREYRTALRRMDAAEGLLAEQVALEINRRRGTATIAVRGWYIDELHSLLRLDTPMPESHQRRRIVATQDGLAELGAVRARRDGAHVRGERARRGRCWIWIRLVRCTCASMRRRCTWAMASSGSRDGPALA